jgi:hypothetical protein
MVIKTPVKATSRSAEEVKKEAAKEPLSRVNFEAPVSLKNRFKARVAEKGESMSEVLTRFMSEYLSK